MTTANKKMIQAIRGMYKGLIADDTIVTVENRTMKNGCNYKIVKVYVYGTLVTVVQQGLMFVNIEDIYKNAVTISRVNALLKEFVMDRTLRLSEAVDTHGGQKVDMFTDCGDVYRGWAKGTFRSSPIIELCNA